MPFALALPFAARTAVLSRGDRRRALSAGPPTAPGRLPSAAAGGGLGCGRRRSRRGAGGATPAHARTGTPGTRPRPVGGQRLPLRRRPAGRLVRQGTPAADPELLQPRPGKPGRGADAGEEALRPPASLRSDTEGEAGAAAAGGESYPSGHTMDSYFKASLLSMLVPEHHDAFFARAEEHAQSRVLAGVHFPSDLEGGQTAAAALVASLLADPAVAADFAAVREELRGALGLPKLQ
ncbi:phosphatase PAP2 family protein [Pseudomonas aeruginosa]|uniref:phosphatase PAP2 family protein n=1 Tax=Pseudomonas aeruginosa TaxID=287 RepID=UPI0032B51256